MIGRTISHYEVLEKLGEGGMGVVYKALDTRLNRHVAIKFLPSHLRADPRAKTRLVHEARAASALNHANIAVVHEIDETPDHQLFIVMALYEGQTLKDRLATGALRVDEAIEIVTQLASGLNAAHSKNILHRDIKPANILMGDDGHAKLADFGLARLAGQTRVTRTGWTVGTVAYMSPEQASGGEADQRSDIFSLGVVLYELLTGKLPFPGEHEAAVLYGIMNSDPTPLANHREGLPSELQRIVNKALSRNPDSRYQTAVDLRTDLQRLLTGANVEVLDSGSGRRSKARWLRSLVIIVFVAAVGAVGYMRVTRSRLDNPAPGDDSRLVIAVAPFWGQNVEALEEGKVMQALVERRLVEELASDESVAIVGKKRIIEAPESDDDAKTMGRQLGATIVLWGEVLVFRGEVEIQPYVTLVKWVHGEEDWSIEGMQTSLEGPDQLSLRKAKAEDVGRIALQVSGTFYRKKDPDKALAILQKIIPPTPESLMEEGLVYCDRGNWSKSAELFSRAVELAPDEPLPYSRMATLYRSEGDYERAIRWSKNAIEADSTFSYSYAMIGSDLIRLRKYDDAIQWLQGAIARFPKSYVVQANMGSAYFRRQQYDVAEVWSDKCINVARGPWELSDAYAFKGTVLQAQGRLDESERWFERAIESDSEQWYAYNRMGMIKYEKQEYEEAIKWFKQVAQLGPTHVHSQLPASYMILGRYSEAAECLRWMLDIRPRDNYSAVMYIICLYRMGEYEKAREFATRQANAPGNVAGYAPVVRFFAGETAEATVLKVAEAENPETEDERKCEVYYFLGVSHLLGVPDGVEPDTTLAMKYFENCVSTGVTRFTEYKLATQILESR